MMVRGGTQAEHYHELLEERADSPCSPEMQRGPQHKEPEDNSEGS